MSREQRPPRRRRSGEPSLVGTTLAGRYHLVRLLGDGGMGAVYKAADQVLRRFVAIKLLHAARVEKRDAVERFVREARAAAAIGHPNIIDILDFGYEHGRPYLVMEYLRGRSLSEALADEGPLPIARACHIATHSLAGLAAAHDRGILHRDLKPANMMLVALLGDADFVKLCDFGFAALLVPTSRIDEGKTLTPARTLVGTPAYAAPERLRGDDRRDPRIDVYSLGVVLYEMLAGRRPFDAPTFRELARKVRREPPPPLQSVRPDIPAPLAEVVERALAKDPQERWSSAEEFAAALVPFGGRVVPFEDCPSDSFTMDLLRIRARETARHPAVSPEEADELLALRRGRQGAQAGARPTPHRADAAFAPADERTEVEPPRADDFADAATIAERGADVRTVADDRSYAGSVPLAVLRLVSREFGERALTDLLASLPEPARRVFSEGISPEQWVSYGAVNALVQAVDTQLGRDDLHLVVQCGEAVADENVELFRAVRPPAPPPEVLLSDMPVVLGKLLRGVEVKVGRLGKGYGRVEVTECGEPSLVFSVLLIGLLDRALELTGATEVEVSLLASPALGDERGIYEASWIS